MIFLRIFAVKISLEMNCKWRVEGVALNNYVNEMIMLFRNEEMNKINNHAWKFVGLKYNKVNKWGFLNFLQHRFIAKSDMEC